MTRPARVPAPQAGSTVGRERRGADTLSADEKYGLSFPPYDGHMTARGCLLVTGVCLCFCAAPLSRAYPTAFVNLIWPTLML